MKKRITVCKRKEYSYIAFRDSNPFEWATGYSKENAVNNLKSKYSDLEKERDFKYIKKIDL